MSYVDLVDSYLLRQFRDFYADVAHLKEQVQAGTWIFSSDAEGEGAAEQHGSANAVLHRLCRRLEHQALDATRAGGDYGAALFREAQYVMAALADEVFLHGVDWQGRETWTNNLVETRLFGTSDAGERLFSRAEELLEQRDPVYAELAVVYFMALALGFRGRYYGREDGGRLNQLKQRLYEFAFRRTANLSGEGFSLFPDAYRYTLQDGAKRELPHGRRWLTACAAAFVLLLLAGQLLWRSATMDAEAALDAAISEQHAQRDADVTASR